MKRKLSKLVTLLLTVAMLVSMALPVSATESPENNAVLASGDVLRNAISASETDYTINKIQLMPESQFSAEEFPGAWEADVSSGEAPGTVSLWRSEDGTQVAIVFAGDTLQARDMTGMFKNLAALSEITFSNVNTSNTSSMAELFKGDTSLSQIDLTSFNTGSVEDMHSMFDMTNEESRVSVLNTILVGDGWSTQSCYNSENMFAGCYGLAGDWGTVFDDAATDATRAVADGDGVAGYLTGVSTGTEEPVQEEAPTEPVAVSFSTRGYSQDPETQYVTIGTPVIYTPEDPVADGYRFTGWFTDEGCTIPYEFGVAVYEPITLYAGWEQVEVPPVYVTVVIDPLGREEAWTPSAYSTDSATTHQFQFTPGSSVYVSPDDLAKPQSEDFLGYFYDAECTQPFNGQEFWEEAYLQLYAGWKVELPPVYVTVTVDPSGREEVWNPSAYSTDNVLIHQFQVPEGGSVYVSPDDLAKPQSESFGGYFYDAECTQPFAGQEFWEEAQLQLYAGFNEVTITLDLMGRPASVFTGDPAMTETQITRIQPIYGGEPIYISPDNFGTPLDESEVRLTGWFYDAECTQPFAGQEFSSSQNLTLYAGWEEIPVWTVSFQAASEEVPVINPEPAYVRNGELAARPEDPSAEGYQFLGWFADEAKTVMFDFEQPIYQDTTVFAGWEGAHTFAVSFDTQGIGTTPETQYIAENETATEPTNMTADGMEFVGWFADAEGTAPFDFSTPITADRTLFGFWKEAVSMHAVTFNTLGRGVQPEGQSIQDGDLVYRPEDPSEAGYIFTGWFTDEAATALYDFNLPVTQDLVLYAGWEPTRAPETPDTYTVTFDAQGHGVTPESQEREEGALVVEPAPLEEEGFLFHGWFTEPECTNLYNFETPVTQNFTLYAGWEEAAAIQYTVSFDMQGHGTQIDPQMVNEGATPYQPEAPQADGWTFIGWYTSNAFDTGFNFENAVYNDTIVYAKWEENIPEGTFYTVSFDTNGHGQAPEPIQVEEGTSFNPPADLAAEGYIFTGWYVERECMNPFNFNNKIYENTTIYAGWKEKEVEPKTHMISFIVNGHGETPNPQTVQDGKTGYDPGELYAEGYIFKGWFTDSEATNKYDFSTPVLDNIILYAGWEVAPPPVPVWNVVFNANRHGENPATQQVEDGSVPTEPEPLTDPGWKFRGWYKESACENRYVFTEPVHADLVLYAGWDELPKTYTVAFNMQGHGDAPASQEIEAGKLATRPAGTPSAEGYKFLGWFADPSGTTAFDFTAPINSNTTVYAVWQEGQAEQKMWTVIFSSNGHGPAVATIQVKDGDAITDPASTNPNAFVVDGYAFNGWFTESACITPYVFGSPIHSDIILYASWTPTTTPTQPTQPTEPATSPVQPPQPYTPQTNPTTPTTPGGNGSQSTTVKYKVWFEMQGHGKSVEPRYVEKGSTIMAPDDPTAEGYTFGGWYYERACLTKFNFNTKITGDLVLYAKWTDGKTTPGEKESGTDSGSEKEDPLATYYTVKFVTDYAQTPEPQRIKAGGKVLQPAVPTTEGKTFTGWYKDIDRAVLFNFNETVQQSFTLYAGWKENETEAVKCTVTFDVQGHGKAPEPQVVNKGGVIQRPEEPTEEGYVFSGWFMENTYMTSYNFNRAVERDMTLYAKWTTGFAPTEATYYVRFETGNGVKAPETQKVVAGKTATKPESPVANGYIVKCWCTDPGCTQEFDFSTPITSDIVLYAKWVVNNVKTDDTNMPWIWIGLIVCAFGFGGYWIKRTKKGNEKL